MWNNNILENFNSIFFSKLLKLLKIIYTDTLEYFNQKIRNMTQENKSPETCELFFVKRRSQIAQLSMNLNFLAES